MTVLSTDEVADQLDGLVHLDTQRAPSGVDLTVAAVFRLTGHGQLDFGGGEFQAAPREPITPVLDDPEDDYGWWTLEAGTYMIRYNESVALDDGQTAELTPLERTLHAGAHHAAFRLDEGRDPLEALLVVGRMGCRLKENCRVTRLRIEE